jgi:hypothetical protein
MKGFRPSGFLCSEPSDGRGPVVPVLQRVPSCCAVLCCAALSVGAPRTGNHAFARDYNAMVPETWHVINDQVRDKRLAVGAAALTCLSVSSGPCARSPGLPASSRSMHPFPWSVCLIEVHAPAPLVCLLCVFSACS